MTINLKNFLSDKSKLSKMGEFQDLKPLDGLEVSSISADLYNNGRDDLALFYFKEGANYATLSTTNSIVSETITWNEKSNKKIIKALLVNTKNANTFTGKQGYEAIDTVAKSLAKDLTLRESKKEEGISETIKIKDLIFASTGVIGETFPGEQIANRINDLVSKLRDDQNKLIWIKTASAIMTTDTKPKLAYEEFTFNNKIIRIAAIAKGSGMIAPNMATMLAFIFTNAQFEKKLFKKRFYDIVDRTFNSSTVDGDTSTSDMALFVSVNTSSKKLANSKESKSFFYSLEKVMTLLSDYIIRDGEGASKFIKIHINGAKNQTDAKNVGKSIANSPLFKTAMAGSDANWGRIIMAIGKSNAKIIPSKLSIRFGKYELLRKGEKLISINLKSIDKYLTNREIQISVDLGIGNSSWAIKTCDFTNKYISINTDYRS